MNSKVAELKPEVLEAEIGALVSVQSAVVAETKNVVLDRVGIWTSSICAVHCLLLPVVFLPKYGLSV